MANAAHSATSNELPDEVKILLTEKKYAEAYPLLIKLTKSGNQTAFFALGNYYVCGRVVAFSCKKAEAFFEKAMNPPSHLEGDTEISRMAKNEVAWINTACNEPRFRRDVLKALRLTVAATEGNDDPYSTDSYAGALANAGQFKRAIEVQKLAIQQLQALAKTESVEPYTFTEFAERLARYNRKVAPRFDATTANRNCNALPE